jgi:hypothetical protein
VDEDMVDSHDAVEDRHAHYKQQDASSGIAKASC